MADETTQNVELEEIHQFYDMVGMARGRALDRMMGWYQHKVESLRANGHHDSCQCQFCCEYRLAKRAFLILRPSDDTPQGNTP